ncbi:MAG: hypothetical protein JXA54_15025 [Candidatus Heimdallarchaeota archaeon]|nr:hypothetical protein [Candidatus Heimdallarchaeota archaeon]
MAIFILGLGSFYFLRKTNSGTGTGGLITKKRLFITGFISFILAITFSVLLIINLITHDKVVYTKFEEHKIELLEIDRSLIEISLLFEQDKENLIETSKYFESLEVSQRILKSIINEQKDLDENSIAEIERSLIEIGFLIEQDKKNEKSSSQYLEKFNESKTLLRSVVMDVNELIGSLYVMNNIGIQFILAVVFSVLLNSIFKEFGVALKQIYGMFNFFR